MRLVDRARRLHQPGCGGGEIVPGTRSTTAADGYDILLRATVRQRALQTLAQQGAGPGHGASFGLLTLEIYIPASRRRRSVDRQATPRIRNGFNVSVARWRTRSARPHRDLGCRGLGQQRLCPGLLERVFGNVTNLAHRRRAHRLHDRDALTTQRRADHKDTRTLHVPFAFRGAICCRISARSRQSRSEHCAW